jgi:hypothetical protein
MADLTFTPDEDGILPVLDGEWFEDDIVSRTRDFLRATFGEATLAERGCKRLSVKVHTRQRRAALAVDGA